MVIVMDRNSSNKTYRNTHTFYISWPINIAGTNFQDEPFGILKSKILLKAMHAKKKKTILYD